MADLQLHACEHGQRRHADDQQGPYEPVAVPFGEETHRHDERCQADRHQQQHVAGGEPLHGRRVDAEFRRRMFVRSNVVDDAAMMFLSSCSCDAPHRHRYGRRWNPGRPARRFGGAESRAVGHV